MPKAICILLVLITIAPFASAHDELRHAELKPLAPLIGHLDVTIEQPGPDGTTTRRTFEADGRAVLKGRMIEVSGFYPFAGFEPPPQLLAFYSWDAFQKEMRAVILDDRGGLMDVFEQVSTDPLQLSNVPTGTYYSENKYYTRLTFRTVDERTVTMTVETSTDTGKSWQPLAVLTYRRR